MTGRIKTEKEVYICIYWSKQRNMNWVRKKWEGKWRKRLRKSERTIIERMVVCVKEG